jgi:hypothetical protein
MVRMRRGEENSWAAGAMRLEQCVQLARGQWRRDEQGGAVRSEGWWESVTVTVAPAAASGRSPSLLHRALASAVDAIAPALAEALAASAWQVLDRRLGPRAGLAPIRGRLSAGARGLPRPGKIADGRP